ncbi:hypothetical protein RHGRI_002750 [Rhododendron griersonianum]|uniref:ARID domain-containing protein n=1 Tax=Rhododendron griersonianum TaxID=479676 RepID=A0AAV6LQN4_9ERIC|nr:hypothetical protein RHGRI_002750 [Rhododendron griersonianum]
MEHELRGSTLEVPVLGDKELDLHGLFVEVTSRGGIHKVVEDRKLDEVVAAFPETKDAVSLLRIYESLLLHYEQLHFSGTQPVSSAALDSDKPVARPRLPPTEAPHSSPQTESVLNLSHNTTSQTARKYFVSTTSNQEVAENCRGLEGGGRGQMAPLETYSMVTRDPDLFREVLKKQNAKLGKSWKYPILEGKEVDLHKLFVEVTSRGGINKEGFHLERYFNKGNNHLWKHQMSLFNKWSQTRQPSAEPQVLSSQHGGLNNSYQSLPQSFESLYLGQFTSPLSQISPAGTNLVQDLVIWRPPSEVAHVSPSQQGMLNIPDTSMNSLARLPGVQCTLGLMPHNFPSTWQPMPSIMRYPIHGVSGQGQPSFQPRFLSSQQGGLVNSFSYMPNLYESSYLGQYLNTLGQISPSAGTNLVIPRLQSAEVHVSAPQHRMPKRSDKLMNTSPGQLGVQYTEVMPRSFHSNAYEPHLTTRIRPAQYSRDGWSIPPAVPRIAPSTSFAAAGVLEREISEQEKNRTAANEQARLWHPKPSSNMLSKEQTTQEENKAIEYEENEPQAEGVGDNFSGLHWIGEDTANTDIHTRLSTGGGQGGYQESYNEALVEESRALRERREKSLQEASQKRPPS